MGMTEARTRENRGDLQGAIREYQRELVRTESLDEQATILISIGRCLLETDLDEAEERIEQAHKIVDGLDSSDLLGEVEVLEGRLAQSRGSHRLAHG